MWSPQQRYDDDPQLIRDLQRRLVQTLQAQHDGRPYALLDFPWFPNVGDSVLWLGARHALEDATGTAPAYAAGQPNLEPGRLRARLHGGTIYLLGGGNFGDLYLHHQQFRTRVIREFPELRIVQLPQSIHFTTAQAEADIRDVIVQHGAVTLMLRDHPSFENAQRMGAQRTLLVPDLAFGLGPRRRPCKPRADVVALRRVDGESRGALDAQWGDCTIRTDWPTREYHQWQVRLARQLTRAGRYPSPLSARMQLSVMDALARWRVERGERMLSQGHYVKTDRLHGHLMCMLLGIPHDVIDNSTGKISAMIDAWTAPSTLLRGRPER
jgi:pyruvyl transferase EpsO